MRFGFFLIVLKISRGDKSKVENLKHPFFIRDKYIIKFNSWNKFQKKIYNDGTIFIAQGF